MRRENERIAHVQSMQKRRDGSERMSSHIHDSPHPGVGTNTNLPKLSRKCLITSTMAAQDSF